MPVGGAVVNPRGLARIATMVRRRAMIGAFVAVLAITLSVGVRAAASPTAPPSEPPVADARLRLATDDVLPSIVEVLEDVHGSVVDDRDGTTHGPYDASFAGTGFFVSADGYIVTAAHVAAPTASELADDLVGGYIDDLYNCDPSTSSDQCAGVEAKHHDEVLPHVRAIGATSDLHVLLQSMKPDDTGMPATVVAASQSSSLDVAAIHVEGLAHQPVALLASRPGDVASPISVIGYPELPAGQPDTVVPTVTVGRVTQVLPPDPTSDVAPGARLVETDAGIRDGNSGGPGVGVDARVEGIVSYGSSDTENFLVAVQDVAGLVARTPAKNVLGPTDAAWRNGLTAEAAGDHPRALQLFQQCASLAPSAVQCVDHARALGGAANVPSSASTAGHIGLGVAALTAGAVLVVAAVVLVVARRRKRRPAG